MTMLQPKRITLKQYLGIVDNDVETEMDESASRPTLFDSQKKWWDLFYKRNENRFFKDRYWTFEEFPELTQTDKKDIVILEAGCGVGNFVIPLMAMNPNLSKLFACDISKNAIELLQKHSNYDKNRCNAFQCDLLSSPDDVLHRHISLNSVDVATLVFVLSAIPPENDNAVKVLRNIQSILKPGGLLLFRDYAEGDQAQLRFEEAGDEKKPLPGCDKCFVRRDNTLSYFFTIEEANRLFVDQCGFDFVECAYVYRETVNRKENITLKRKFIQGRYRKRQV